MFPPQEVVCSHSKLWYVSTTNRVCSHPRLWYALIPSCSIFPPQTGMFLPKAVVVVCPYFKLVCFHPKLVSSSMPQVVLCSHPKLYVQLHSKLCYVLTPNWPKLVCSYPKLVSLSMPQAVLIIMIIIKRISSCLLYTSPSPRDDNRSRMPSSA